MMQEKIQNIIEKVNIQKKDKMPYFLRQCIKVCNDRTETARAIHKHVVIFKTDLFFEGVAQLSNEVTKNKKIALGVHVLQVTLEELGFEIDKEDVFILFHLRKLGKFKITDVKLHNELKGLWGEHKEYALEDNDFSYSIRALMKMGLIDYRKGRLGLKQNIMIVYRIPV